MLRSIRSLRILFGVFRFRLVFRFLFPFLDNYLFVFFMQLPIPNPHQMSMYSRNSIFMILCFAEVWLFILLYSIDLQLIKFCLDKYSKYYFC